LIACIYGRTGLKEEFGDISAVLLARDVQGRDSLLVRD
jgi:hypothetical protein